LTKVRPEGSHPFAAGNAGAMVKSSPDAAKERLELQQQISGRMALPHTILNVHYYN